MGIYVNWWITQKSGVKISKSKGGAEPIPNAALKYGVDTMRLYYAHIASPFADIEWDSKAVEQYKKRLYKIYTLQNELLKKRGTEKDIDEWLSASFNKEIHNIIEKMEKYELRKAANSIYFNLYNKFYWYLKRGGENAPLIKKFLRKWIQSMVPFTPHIAEEMWERIGGKSFVSEASFPEKGEINAESLENEALIIKTIEDISEIIKVTKIVPSHIYIYTAPQWKWEVIEKANELEKEKKLEIGMLIKETLKKKDLKKFSRHIPKYAQKVIKEMQKGERYTYLDELKILNRAKEFIEKEFNTEISIYKSEEDAPDPGGKKTLAEPLRPALYVK
jgi:leucyl-tRNA synthetase